MEAHIGLKTTTGGSFVTPPGWWHSHHNDSDEDAWVLPMQDAGLYTQVRALMWMSVWGYVDHIVAHPSIHTDPHPRSPQMRSLDIRFSKVNKWPRME